MAFCAECGVMLQGDAELCLHHHVVLADDWAEGNRILCDWLHRGIEPTRLAPDLREDPVVST